MRKTDETRNYFFEEIKHNYLVSKHHKNVCKVLNYIENLPYLVSTVTGCVSILTAIISKALIDSSIDQKEFVLMTDELK